MAKTIGTAEIVKHDRCGKEVARIINGVLHVPCVRRGCKGEHVALNDWVQRDRMAEAIKAILSGAVSPEQVMALTDPLADYRQTDGLILIGPEELDRACHGPNGENPLGLKSGWIPEVPVPTDLDRWIRSLVWRDHKDWQTRAALVLTPPEIGGIPTSLIGQNAIWGVAHDGTPAGQVRQDVFWSNYFVRPCHEGNPGFAWAKDTAADEWRWTLAYEHPVWTAQKNWAKQQEAASKRQMPIMSVARDTFALNAVLAAAGIRLRPATWSRTCTIYDGYPLDVYSYGYGVHAGRDWNPENASAGFAASVEGIDCTLAA